MAKGKRGRPERRSEPHDEPESEPGSEDTGLPDPALLLPGEWSEEARCTVQRLDERTGKWTHQFYIHPNQATTELLQEFRGGGKYRLFGRDRTESGKWVTLNTCTVDVDGPPKPLTHYPSTGQKIPQGGRPVVGTLPGNGDGDRRVGMDDVLTAGVLDLLKASREQNQAAIDAIRASQQTRGPGVLEIINALAPVLKDAITAFQGARGPAPAGSGAALKELTDIIGSVKQLIAAPTDPAKREIALIERMLDLKDRLGLGDEPDDRSTAERLAETYLPRLLDLADQQRTTPGQPRIAPAKQPPRPAVTAGEGSPQPVWKQFLGAHKKRLLSQAQRDKAAEVIAEYDWEVLPEQFRGPVKEFIGTEGILEMILAEFPEFAQYRAWFTTYFSTLYELCYPEPEEDDDGEDGEEDGPETPGADPGAPGGAAETPAAE